MVEETKTMLLMPADLSVQETKVPWYDLDECVQLRTSFVFDSFNASVIFSFQRKEGRKRVDFDPTDLERAAKAVRELDKSSELSTASAFLRETSRVASMAVSFACS